MKKILLPSAIACAASAAMARGACFMNIDKSALPKLANISGRPNFSCDIAQSAIERWSPNLQPVNKGKDDDEVDNSISILDAIGKDFWGEGVTSKRIAAALRSIGERDVVVNINSPGGDLFEGITIYNMLRDHPKKVTVRVLGVAASAASIIAMAGDEIQVARAGFLMIHNVWVVGMGDRNDFQQMADTLSSFDDALAEVYAVRTGKEKKAISKMMDKETWLSGSQAVEEGFAHSLLAADEIEAQKETEEEKNASMDMRLMDLALARAGISRSERRAMMNRIRSTPRAASTGTQIAAEVAVGKDLGETVGRINASVEQTKKFFDNLK